MSLLCAVVNHLWLEVFAVEVRDGYSVFVSAEGNEQ